MVTARLVKIIGELEQGGITFESLSEQSDTGRASGKLRFHVFAALAEFERNLIRERTLAGLTTARARGRVGEPKPKPKLSDKQILEIRALPRRSNRADQRHRRMLQRFATHALQAGGCRAASKVGLI